MPARPRSKVTFGTDVSVMGEGLNEVFEKIGSLSLNNVSIRREEKLVRWYDLPEDFEICEDRFACDAEYRAAVEYMDLASPECISEAKFHTDPKYRMAVAFVATPETNSLKKALEDMTSAVTILDHAFPLHSKDDAEENGSLSKKCGKGKKKPAKGKAKKGKKTKASKFRASLRRSCTQASYQSQHGAPEKLNNLNLRMPQFSRECLYAPEPAEFTSELQIEQVPMGYPIYVEEGKFGSVNSMNTSTYSRI